jgi:hypothetical protein
VSDDFSASTGVALVRHILSIDGRVLEFSIQPIGPVPTEDVARAAFQRALKLHPWIAGTEPQADANARQIFLGQVGQLCICVNELVRTADFHRVPRQELAPGAIWLHEQLADYFQMLRQRVQDIGPYLQKERSR